MPDREELRQALAAGEAGQDMASVPDRRQQLAETLQQQGVADARNTLPAAQEADGLWEALEAGYQKSNTGLWFREQAPEVVLSQNSSRFENIVSYVGQLAGDIPTLAVGGIVGGVGGSFVTPGVGTAVGAGAGAEGLTQGTRAWLMQKYAEGANKRDLADRLTATAWATAKGATIGGLTAGAGAKALGFARAGVTRNVGMTGALPGQTVPTYTASRIQSTVGQHAFATAAEASTLVGVASVLEGEMPGPDDFINAAAVLGGLKIGIGVGGAAGRGVQSARQRRQVRRRQESVEAMGSKLEDIYARTGVKPKQVVEDAQKDSTLWQQLIDDEYSVIPDKYKPLERSPLRPDVRQSIPEGMEPELVAAVQNPLRWEISQQRGKAHLNFDTFDMPGGAQKLADTVTATMKDEILAETRGGVPLEQISREAMDWVRNTLGDEAVDSIYSPGTADFAAEMLGRKYLAQNMLKDAAGKAIKVNQKGDAATSAEIADVLLSVDRAARLQKVYRGRTAELGRAMRALQDKLNDPVLRDNEGEVVKALERFGGKDAARTYADVVSQINDPAALARLARKPTTFEQIVFGYKSALLSGSSTMQITTLGNIVHAAFRVPEKVLAATYSTLTGRKDRVAFSDAVGYTLGHAAGVWDAFRNTAGMLKANIESEGAAKGLLAAWRNVPMSRKLDLMSPDRRAALKDAVNRKVESEGLSPGTAKFRSRSAEIMNEMTTPEMLPGIANDIVRIPFNVASLGDVFSKTMLSRAVIWENAVRQARKENLTPFSPAWKKRVSQFADDPPQRVIDEGTKVGERVSFQEQGKATEVLHFVTQKFPVTEIFPLPFRTAAAAAPREFTRRTPLAPIIESWRADWKKGGAERHQAMAEVIGGSAIGFMGFMLAREGVITGSGHPDSKQRQADYNAGFQPYSLVMKDGTQVQLARWEPLGTLLGMSADVATAWDLMESGEKEDAAWALGWAGREVFLNKTWLRGVSELVSAIETPERALEGTLEGLVSSTVPNIIAQHAQSMDPYVREVDSILDAVQNRIPKLRESLPVRIDGFGQPIPASDRAWPGSPSLVRQQSDDPVRVEAAKVGAAMPAWPDSLHAGSVLGEGARVELGDEERTQLATEAGRMAYDMMSEMVRDPGWSTMPPLVRRRLFERTYRNARKAAASEVLDPSKADEALRTLMMEEGLAPRGMLQ